MNLSISLISIHVPRKRSPGPRSSPISSQKQTVSQFLKVYKDYEEALREAKLDVKSFEARQSENTRNMLQLCRGVRNYLSHNNGLFAIPSGEMINYLSHIVKEMNRRNLSKNVQPCSPKTKDTPSLNETGMFEFPNLTKDSEDNIKDGVDLKDIDLVSNHLCPELIVSSDIGHDLAISLMDQHHSDFIVLYRKEDHKFFVRFKDEVKKIPGKGRALVAPARRGLTVEYISPYNKMPKLVSDRVFICTSDGTSVGKILGVVVQ